MRKAGMQAGLTCVSVLGDIIAEMAMLKMIYRFDFHAIFFRNVEQTIPPPQFP